MKIEVRSLFLSTVVFLITILLSACGQISAKDPLNKTAWSLSAIDETPSMKGTKVTVDFSDGQISGSAGCNSYGGSYKIKGEKITISSLVMTMMACQDTGVMEQEQTFIQYLQDAQTFKVNGEQLQIFSSDDKVLVFIPQK
ncbi:MAG: META domain-containing protein [Anaerolineaceae bacterium]|jgi:heat shock protein HslJ|nr:MAG: META domain-containing protein [Anaerolineaceae bacterium]